MIGIVVASPLEAAPFLDLQKWQPVEMQPVSLYKGLIGPSRVPAVLVISGIGKVAAAVATHMMISTHGAKRIFNPGVCGALKTFDAPAVGRLFRIDTAIEGDRQAGPEAVLPENCASDPFDALPVARLVTCDQPVFDAERKKSLVALGDLVDMEGAAVARVANMFALPCVLLKGITDGAEEGGRAVLKQNIDVVSRKLATAFYANIGTLAAKGNDT